MIGRSLRRVFTPRKPSQLQRAKAYEAGACLCFCLLANSASAFEIDELFDRLDAALTVAAFQDNFRARLSGTIDLEFYNFEQPAPG